MGQGFLTQEDIPTIEGLLLEITPTSHLMAMLRIQTTAFVMKLRNNEAFPERDIARVEFQRVTPSQKFLANNLVLNPYMLGCLSCPPRCIASPLQASTYSLLLQPPLPAPTSTPHQALQHLLAHRWCSHLPNHLHRHLPLTLAVSHQSLSLGWALETLEEG